MKTEAIMKINKMGKIGLILSRIWFVVCCIGIAGLLISNVVMFILPKDFVQIHMDGDASMTVNVPAKWVEEGDNGPLPDHFSGSVSVGNEGTEVKLTDVQIQGNQVLMTGRGAILDYNTGHIRMGLLVATLALIIAAITAFFACKLCKDLRNCETPFEEVIIKDIQLIAYSLIPWCVIENGINAVSLAMQTGSANVLSISIEKILICLIIFGIAYIFKYGARLQQEADETL